MRGYWGIFIPGLTLMFIYLKLTGVIMWSWWWVLAPIWFVPAIVFLTIGAIFGVAILMEKK